MYSSIDINAAAGHLKNIVDSIRCLVCDKTSGVRVRYACGHTSCENCAVFADECSLCLTLRQNSSKPVLDDPLTQRIANALNLLNVFENEFHIDVYKHQRISEQLKAEKEIFPECIQAPAKYSNKRKTKQSIADKENRLSQLPGEQISLINSPKMEKSGNVEMWLNKYVRKPFADLNSNDQRLSQDAKVLKNKQNVQTENTPSKQTRKRSYCKSALSSVKNQTLIVDHLSPVKKTLNIPKKPRIDLSPLKPDTSVNNTGLRIKNNDESGIDMDMEDEAVIVIDESQSMRVDKDYNAWLAVLEAERNKILSSSEDNTRSIEQTPLKDKVVHTDISCARKVPFLLRSSLCKCIEVHCKEEIENKNIQPTKPILNNIEHGKDTSITISNESFMAIITIKQDQPTMEPISKESVGAQADITETELLSVRNIEEKDKCVTRSQDVFEGNGELIEKPEEICEKSLKRIENVVIQESDSDDDIGPSHSLEVTAEIHRSSEEVDYGILADIDDLEEHGKRERRRPRGLTPTSTDSSEKENFNPNRVKKTCTSKKKPNKKYTQTH